MSAPPAAESRPQPSGTQPRILFFSGGSAINPVARQLKRHTVSSIHLVTPFDSGGSSGSLRRRFGMPAVGDLRSRMLALCNEDDPRALAMREVLDHRFAETGPPLPLGKTLLATASHELARQPALAGSCGAGQLLGLLETLQAHADFDLRGASLGNLALTAAYLNNGRSLSAAGRVLGDWLDLRGTVRCTVDADLQLAVRLRDGRSLVGQHEITGKERPPLNSPVERIWLVDPHRPDRPASCAIGDEIAQLIRSADLLVYAPGSFFSSLLVHCLPQGVNAAIAANAAPKVYVPNLGRDPELLGHDPAAALTLLLAQLAAGQAGTEPARLVSHVLVDKARTGEFSALPAGLRLCPAPLQGEERGRHDAAQLVRALLDLAARRHRL